MTVDLPPTLSLRSRISPLKQSLFNKINKTPHVIDIQAGNASVQRPVAYLQIEYGLNDRKDSKIKVHHFKMLVTGPS